MTTTRDTRTPVTDALRRLVDDVLLAVTAQHVDRYSRGTAQALLCLAALARRAAAALATESADSRDGVAGPVALEEFATAARLLGEAADAAHGESWQIADLLVRAERVRAQFPVGRG